MTREEALNILHNASVYHPDYLDALNMAIKALEQKPILEKIRAEIELHRRKTESIDPYDLVGDCLDIIDKYTAESEDNVYERL